jgi:RNA polymerase sigma-70 factor (ECF subfamily)
LLERLRAADDRTLVMLARTGSDPAFEELVRRRQGMVRGLLRRLSGNAATGDDLAQETFVRAWRALGQLRDPDALGSWLRQIAVTVWLQHARRFQAPTDPIEDHEPELTTGDQTAQVVERLDLATALAHLRPSERLCLVLAHSEGMSHAEIARVTGMPLGTVKSHVSRGLQRLRMWLAPDSKGAGL